MRFIKSISSIKKREEVYKELKKKYTDEELADSFIFSIELPREDQEEVDEEFLKLRLEKLKAMSDEELISSDLFVFKLRLKEYFKSTKFDNGLELITKSNDQRPKK